MKLNSELKLVRVCVLYLHQIGLAIPHEQEYCFSQISAQQQCDNSFNKQDMISILFVLTNLKIKNSSRLGVSEISEI